MKIKHITLKNILGIREFNLDVDGPTIIEGGNGAGKSSVLKGLQTMIGGGSLATLRNLDAGDDEPSEGVLVLESDEHGLVRIEKDDKGLKVKKQVGESAAFEDVNAPQKWLNRLFDTNAMNPVSFLTTNPKNRIALLLDAIPFDYSSDELWESMGLDRNNFSYPKRSNAIKEIASIRQAIFEERTGVNRDAKGEAEACDKMRRTIPAELPEVGDLDEISDKIAGRNADAMRLKERAYSDASSKKAKAASVLKNVETRQRLELADLRARLDEDVRKQLERKRLSLRGELTEHQVARDRVCEKADEELREQIGKYNGIMGEVSSLREKMAEMQEQQKSAIRTRTLAEEADRHESEARTLKALSKRLTAALDTLDEYKADLCSGIPIDGLEIDGDGITVDGVPWDHVNTGRQIRVAVELACLRLKGPLRPVFLDKVESLDDDTLRLLLDELGKAGAQPFLARVTDGELKVTK